MDSTISRWQVISTMTIILFSIPSTLLGLFQPGQYPAELLPGFYIQDALLLVVGVPALAVGLWYAIRGSLRGYVLWLGALSYMTYLWATIGLQVVFNQFFLGYILLFGLSMYTLIGAIAKTNPEEIRDAVAGHLSERVFGAFLWIIAIGLAFLWLSELVPATLSGTPPLLVAEIGPQALASHFIDLSVVVPAMAIAGTWLWRHRSWGYVFAGVGLVFGGLLAPTLTGVTLILLVGGEITVPAFAVVFTAVPALIAAGLAIKYLLAISPTKSVGNVDIDDRPREKHAL